MRPQLQKRMLSSSVRSSRASLDASKYPRHASEKGSHSVSTHGVRHITQLHTGIGKHPDLNRTPLPYTKLRRRSKTLTLMRSVRYLSNRVAFTGILASLIKHGGASPVGLNDAQSISELGLWIIVHHVFTKLFEFCIGALFAGVVLVALRYLVIRSDSNVPSEDERKVHHVLYHSVASLLGAGMLMLLLKTRDSGGGPNTADTVVFSAALVFWLSSHVLFWKAQFELHNHLGRHQRLVPWLIGAVGVVWSLLKTPDGVAAQVACMFWGPILVWPNLVRWCKLLRRFSRHAVSFRGHDGGVG